MSKHIIGDLMIDSQWLINRALGLFERGRDPFPCYRSDRDTLIRRAEGVWTGSLSRSWHHESDDSDTTMGVINLLEPE